MVNVNIEFKNWIESQGISTDAKALFDEAIICYRVAAYRSAYLMSYVGFLVVIKERVLSSEKPSFVSEQQWENEVLKELRNDDKWEEHTMNILNKKDSQSRSKYFLVNTHLLNDIDYFKRRRNDCAHAKDTKIDHSHIEVLWNFLQSHLSKFVINGGREGLLSKIEKHFDPHQTRPNTNPTYLIDEIPLVVQKSNIPDLLEEIAKEHVDFENPFIDFYPEIDFWSKVAYHQNTELNESLKIFLLKDKARFAVFMHYFPDYINYFESESPIVRYIWQRALFSDLHGYSGEYWDIPTTLLRNGYIPEEEKSSFFSKLVKEIDRYSDIPKPHHLIVLREHGFFEHMRNYIIEDIFENGRASYIKINNNSEAIMIGLKNVELNAKLVELLNRYFQGYEFGTFKNSLGQYIKDSPEFLERFHEIATGENLILHPFFNNEE